MPPEADMYEEWGEGLGEGLGEGCPPRRKPRPTERSELYRENDDVPDAQ